MMVARQTDVTGRLDIFVILTGGTKTKEYMDEAAKKMIENLQKNTGKSLQQWVDIVKGSGWQKHGEIIKYLKSDHGFTHGFANLVAHKSKGSDAGSAVNPDDLITTQYKGKESLRPIYDRMKEVLKAFGDDVAFAPKKAYVSVKRKKQFAILQPSTKTRFDVGIQLKEVEPTERLLKSGSWNTMVSHRVKIAEVGEVNEELAGWLKEAYEKAQ
ncbi:MAG: DUF5655 domain-containing protein [Bacteroidota bacterium]